MIETLKRWFGRRNGVHNVDLSAHAIPRESRPVVGTQTNQHFGSANLLGDFQEILGVFNPRLVGIRDKLLMRQDPDIAFGIAVVTAPIMNLEWTIESDDPIIKEFVRIQVDRIYRRMAVGMSNAVGFGWQAAEKVWKVEDEVVEIQNDKGVIERKVIPNAWIIEKTKALDPQTVALLIDRDNDEWAGIEQNFLTTGEKKQARIGRFNSLLWSFRSEQVFGNLRGWGLFWQAHAPWWSFVATDLFCNRYFQRKGDPGYKAHAGATILKGGKEVDGFEYMAQQTQLAQTSGSVVLPNIVDPTTGERMFDIEELSAQQRGDMFDRRLQYLSIQKLRALWLTDRVGTAGGGGGIGTGEADVHQDTFLMLADQIVREFVDDVINAQVVDQLVLMNFGKEALKSTRTKLVASGLSAATEDLFKQLITKVMDQESILEDGGSLKLKDMIDGVAVLDSMGIPLKSQEELKKIAADKQDRRDTFAGNLNTDPDPEDGNEVDDESVTKDLEDEGILSRGEEPPKDESLTALPDPKDEQVLALDLTAAAALAEVNDLVTAGKLTRKVGLGLMARLGLSEEDAERALGKAPDVEPKDAPTDMMAAVEALASKLEAKHHVEYLKPTINMPEIRIPPQQAQKDMTPKILEILDRLARHPAPKPGKPSSVDDDDMEFEVMRDKDGRMKMIRMKRKKK